MSSTESLQNSTMEQQQVQDRDALREGLVLADGLNRLGKMAAIKSLHRNMQTEDALVKKNLEKCEEEFFGDDDVGKSKGGDIEDDMPMDIMAARDVVIHNKSPMDNSNESKSAAKKNSVLGPVLGAIGATAGTGALLASLLGYLSQNINSSPEIVPPAVKVDDVELEVSWEVMPNGETKIDVQEVPNGDQVP